MNCVSILYTIRKIILSNFFFLGKKIISNRGISVNSYLSSPHLFLLITIKKVY